MPTLNLPTPGVTPGTAWATQLNTEIGKVNTAVDNLTNNSGFVDISGVVSLGNGYYADPSGFTCRVRKIGYMAEIQVTGVRKSAGTPDLTIGVTGVTTGTRTLITGIPAAYRPSQPVALGSAWEGRANSYVLSNAGSVVVYAMVPSATQTGSVLVPTDEIFSCQGTYLAI